MAESYERHVSDLAEQADETSDYIAQLESAYDQEAAESGRNRGDALHRPRRVRRPDRAVPPRTAQLTRLFPRSR